MGLARRKGNGPSEAYLYSDQNPVEVDFRFIVTFSHCKTENHSEQSSPSSIIESIIYPALNLN